MNKMREVRLEKLTLNIGVGEAGDALEKAKKLMKEITNREPIETKAKKKIPALKIRPGLPIGVKVTIRKGAEPLLKRLLEGVDNTLTFSCFNGRSVSFGIDEYIHIPGINYDPNIGIIGLNVSVSLMRPGLRVKNRRIRPAAIGVNHQITTEDSIKFFKKEFGTKVVEVKS